MDTKELHALIAKKKALKDAGPDMLEALESLVNACEYWEDQEDPVLVKAREAIAKAKGE